MNLRKNMLYICVGLAVGVWGSRVGFDVFHIVVIAGLVALAMSLILREKNNA